jgi:hypothetical protein
MSISEISDVRLEKHFKKISFSDFKKTDVKKELLNNLKSGNIERSCYWSAELICAAHFMDIWEIIMHFMSRFIYLGNPKLPLYIKLKIDDFKKIVNKGYHDNLIKMRNVDNIRKLFCEIMCVLCLSMKKNQLQSIKIKEEDFNITKISHRLKADGIQYCQSVFLKEDPKELFIAINEFVWNISNKSSNTQEACYWFEWIIGFEKACKKNKKLLIAHRRNISVDNTFQKDIIWIIWDCLLLAATKKNSSVSKIVKALMDIFCLKYTPSCKNKRKYLIYYSINLITEPLNSNIKIVKNGELVKKITNKIDTIYKQIQKNAKKPSTDYLFNNSINKNNNLEKTISKLDKLSSMEGFIPRNT